MVGNWRGDNFEGENYSSDLDKNLSMLDPKQNLLGGTNKLLKRFMDPHLFDAGIGRKGEATPEEKRQEKRLKEKLGTMKNVEIEEGPKSLEAFASGPSGREAYAGYPAHVHYRVEGGMKEKIPFKYEKVWINEYGVLMVDDYVLVFADLKAHGRKEGGIINTNFGKGKVVGGFDSVSSDNKKTDIQMVVDWAGHHYKWGNKKGERAR